MITSILRWAPPAERIVTHQQRNAEHRHVVWQFAMGTGVHVGNKRGGCFSKIALVEIVKGSLLFAAAHESGYGP
jgi:hypothetical protein